MCADPLVTLRIFHMFGCRELKQSAGEHTDAESWHRYDYSINCNSDEYLNFRTLAQLMVLLYPLGIPAAVLWIFHRNSERLTDESLLGNTTPVSDGTDEPGSNAIDSAAAWATAQEAAVVPWWYGDRSTFNFMVRDFQPRYYFFEIVEFMRKLGLTGLVMIIEPGSVMQICVAITIAFAFAAVNAVVRPYADPRANYMRLLADTSLFFTLLCILVLHFVDHLDPCEPLQNSFIGWFLIIMNFVLLLLFVCAEMVSRAVRMYSDSLFVGISYRPDAPLNMRIDDQFSTGLVQATNVAANVYRGEYKAAASAQSVPCAVKIRPKNQDSRVVDIEAAIMLSCNHSNVVRIYHLEEDAGMYYLCTELCSELSVEIAVLRGKVESADARINLCRSMLEGLQAFHTAGFVHGNCTPSNFVLGDDGVPRLCGFSSSNVSNHAAAATKLNTMGGTVGYMPSEIINGRRISMKVEVANPVAVDTFSLGCTLCFVLSDSQRPFHGNLMTSTVERNIQTGVHGVEHIGSLSTEAKHLIAMMVSHTPGARPPLNYILKHPLFWDMTETVKYLATIGGALGTRFARKSNPFVNDIEQAVDAALGSYNEADPAAGGSWSRQLCDKYPLGGDWGKQQRPPADEEHAYHIYGAPPSKKQAAQREAQLAAGKLSGTHQAKEIRSVGLLKFIRNVSVHGEQMLQMNRFESKDALQHYLIDPFPWLLIAVFEADEKHRFSDKWNDSSGSGANTDGEGIDRGGDLTSMTANPLSGTTSSPAILGQQDNGGAEPAGPPPAQVGEVTAL
eukprot:COSAG02_NODE_326_length_24603_cov_123.455681_2_plen_787_part_00